MRSLKSTVDLLVFGNFYIAGAAVVMYFYTAYFFKLEAPPEALRFVFFSTLCSYSLHWFLTPPETPDLGARIAWTREHKTLLGLFFLASLPGAAYYFYLLRKQALWLALPAIITFLYTAPKIPFRPFIWLRRYVIGKTLYLAIVWTFVTAALPLILSGAGWNEKAVLFFVNRFFLILPVCLLFDYRDKAEDQKSGIKNLVAYIGDRQLNSVYWVILVIFWSTTVRLFFTDRNYTELIINATPQIILALIFAKSKIYKSDYWFYILLDGVMAFSGVFCLINLYIYPFFQK